MLTRAELIAQIQKRLEERLSDAQLSAWAFERFYANELGSESFEPAAAHDIASVLDDLMFATDEGFALDAVALRALVKRLEQE
jgi:hypothetical protein